MAIHEEPGPGKPPASDAVPAEEAHRQHTASLLTYTLAAGIFILHIIVNIFTPYGFHRDEFLYIAQGSHLHLWRMDSPPFIGAIADITRGILGNSLWAIRFFPALAASILVLLAADIARRLGGKTFARLLAALLVFFAPIFLRPGALFQPVVFDQLWWTLGIWVIIRWRETEDGRWWIALGIAMALGLLTKFSIFVFGFGVLVGLLATKDRRILFTRWPWIALGVTFIIGSPSIVGQIRLGFPFVGMMQNLQSVQFTHVSWADFVTGQIFILSLVPFVIALTGIIALFVSKRFARFRILGWIFAGTFAVLFIMHSKAYYLGAIYPAMLGAGAVILEKVGTGWRGTAFKIAVVALVVANGIILIPMGVPVLPPKEMAKYAASLGLTQAVQTNTGVELRLPQDYADMLGWEQRVNAISGVYRSLTPEERSKAVIIGSNYGEAGAVDFLGPRFGLPHSICFEGTYWFFGPGRKAGTTAISIGFDSLDLVKNWRSVTPMAHIMNKWTVPEEQDLTIYLCRNEMRTIQQLWPSLKGEF